MRVCFVRSPDTCRAHYAQSKYQWNVWRQAWYDNASSHVTEWRAAPGTAGHTLQGVAAGTPCLYGDMFAVVGVRASAGELPSGLGLHEEIPHAEASAAVC